MTPTADRLKQSPEVLVRRAFAYSLLAAALNDPDEAGIAQLQELVAAGSGLADGTCLAGVSALAATATTQNLLAVHTRLFSLSSSPDCPAFESAFACAQPGEQTALMADVAGFYRAFGVDTGGNGLRPDDIRVELEFMAYLCRKQIYAVEHLGAPRVAQVVRAMRMFLAEHLGRWAPALGRGIAAKAGDSAFYAATGVALSLWLQEECQRLSVIPAERFTAPVMPLERPVPEPDDLAFEGDTGPLISLDEIEVS